MDLEEIGWGGMDWIDLSQDELPVQGPYGHCKPSGFHKMLHNWRFLKKGSAPYK
jgi:hypothetical protein